MSLPGTVSEMENCGAQDTVPNLAQNNVMDIAGTTPSSLSTLSGSSHPLASIHDNMPAEPHQGSRKRVKGLAVVGRGLMDKYNKSQQVM